MWFQIIGAALGLWLTAAPGVLGYGAPAATSDHIAGPVATTFALIACWEATRSVRWVNVGVGAWVLLAPWILGYSDWSATLAGTVTGLFLALSAIFKGRVSGQYGGGWTVLWHGTPAQDPIRKG